MGRRPLLIVVTAVAVVIAALPIILTVALGWYHTDFLASMLGKGAGIYVILVLVYVVWLPATVVGLVFVYDRLGLHYQAMDRPPKRPRRREELRRRATANAMAAEESAQLAAQRAARERERSRAARRPRAAAKDAASDQPDETPGTEPPAADRDSEAGEGQRRPKAG